MLTATCLLLSMWQELLAYLMHFEKFTDDGTAIIEPLAGPLPVTLKSFTALLLHNNYNKIRLGNIAGN